MAVPVALLSALLGRVQLAAVPGRQPGQLGPKPPAMTVRPIHLEPRPGRPRAFVDDLGREVIFHGTAAVVKGPPWHPALQKYKNRSDPIDPSAHLGAELWLLLRQLERIYKVYHTVCLGCQGFE